MMQLQQIHQDIDALPEEAQNLLAEFVHFLKYRYLHAERKSVETNAKLIDLMQFSNVIDWDVDGLEYQQQLRSEWE